MRAARLFVFVALLSLPAWGDEPASPDRIAERERADVITAGLLDPATPAERRAELATRLETYADQRNDPSSLYVVGSLYRLGSAASPTSPYPRNPDKAREYLARAALKGYLNAMSKLALIELDAGNRFEANVWAQLQAHYEIEFARERHQGDASAAADSGVSGILVAAQDGFPKQDVPRLEARIGEMIRSFDKAIRAGRGEIARGRAESPLQNARADQCDIPIGQWQRSQARRSRYYFGGAEYYVSFADDGSADRIWLLDVWPDLRMERSLRTCAGRYRVKVNEAIAGKGRVALLPMVVTDPRLKLRTDAN